MTGDQINIPDLKSASRMWEMLADGPAPADAPVIAGFRVLSPLGSGGQGATWLAEREPDGKLVVIKFARFRGSAFPDRHWKELRLLSERRSSAIARFEGSGTADGHPWLATEFIDGPSLDLWAVGRPATQLLEMLARVADRLSELHGAGVVHRDIKPANVIVASGGIPVLIDLGLGAFIDAPLDRTIEGLPAGSPAFMSPEQARGERAVIGPATDLWSLGATAFLLLAGELPHAAAGSVAAQVARAGTEPPRRARDLAPSLPRAVAEVLDWAVQPRIEDRPPDAATFARALRLAAAGRSMARVRSTAPGRRARRWWIAAGCVLLGALSVPLVVRFSRTTGAAVGPTSVLDVIPLTTEHGTMVAGDYPHARFGHSISVLGDLDGDGQPEVAIGAPTAPGRQPDGRYVELAGEVSVVRGSDILATAADGAPAVLSPAHRIAGANVRGHVGAMVCSAGDMDGDHIEELAILGTGPTEDAGTVTIVRGSDILRTRSLADAVAAGHAVRIEGVEIGKLPSGMIACDVDGDGLSDLLIGCPGAAGPAGARTGEVLVVHGAGDLFGPAARPAVMHRVGAPDGVFGFGVSLATVCGPDGPSTTQYVVIGAPLGDRAGPGGTGRIVLARADAFAIAGRMSAPVAIASRGGPDEWFGESVAAESTAIAGVECRTIHVLGGGSGVANAANDGGMAASLEFTINADGQWQESADSTVWRGTEASLGRGQLMGAAVAMRKDHCCSLPCAIASPRDGAADVAAGSVTIRDLLTERSDRDQATYRGAKRGFEAGRSVAWWHGGAYPPDRAKHVALLIGAPGEDSPAREEAAGAVWIVWREVPDPP